jgi:nucleotide-binding universal stress UspA family protein
MPHLPGDRRSGIPTTFATQPAGEVLLDKSEAIGRALLVMGAYSHSRWQERIFGGATEFILHESTSPVLLMH